MKEKIKVLIFSYWLGVSTIVQQEGNELEARKEVVVQPSRDRIIADHMDFVHLYRLHSRLYKL